PAALWPRAVAAASSLASGPKARGISLDMAAGSPLPLGVGLYEAEPPFWICRVVTVGALGAADALVPPMNGSIPTPRTSAAVAASFLRLGSDIPRSLTGVSQGLNRVDAGVPRPRAMTAGRAPW